MSSIPSTVTNSDERSRSHTIYEKKQDAGEDTDREPLEKTSEVDTKEDEYPSGFRFFFVIVALVLSTFLIALDMV